MAEDYSQIITEINNSLFNISKDMSDMKTDIKDTKDDVADLKKKLFESDPDGKDCMSEQVKKNTKYREDSEKKNLAI